MRVFLKYKFIQHVKLNQLKNKLKWNFFNELEIYKLKQFLNNQSIDSFFLNT